MDYKKWLFDVSVWLVIILTARHANAAEGSARQSEWVNDYAVSWNSPSLDSKGSMPLGNGDLGLNVWTVKDGDLWFYIGKGDSWGDWADGHTGLLKVGRVRVKLTPNPFTGDQPFTQRLDLLKGRIVIIAGQPGRSISLTVLVDANRPLVRMEARSEMPFTLEASFESTRPDEPGAKNADRVVGGLTNTVAWYYRSQNTVNVPELKDHIFGALMRGEGLVSQGGKTVVSQAPGKAFDLAVHALTLQPATPERWLEAVHAQADDGDRVSMDAARRAHETWWADFWNRSWIQVTGDEKARQVTQGYLLQRYKNACAGRGRWPIHFNGSIFTVDSKENIYNYTTQKYEIQPVNGDYRGWGCRFWWQNNRAMYWPMLASGDFDLMKPLFDYYRRVAEVNRKLVKEQHGFDGVYFSEITPMGGGLLHKLSPELKGEFVAHHINAILEFSAMAFDYYHATGDEGFARETLIPIATDGLTFFANYFPRDDKGMLLLDPDNALETYWKVRNPTPDVAGLRWVTAGLLELPETLTTPELRKQWGDLRRILPPIPLGAREGKQVILPCEKMNPETRNPPEDDGKPEMESPRYVRNMENPELYAVYPFRFYGVGKPDLDRALASYETRRFKTAGCWHQSPVFAAYLGLAGDARDYLTQIFHPVGAPWPEGEKRRFDEPPKGNDFRFPGFWGPGYDYSPDEDHGGNGMHTLQLMLMQCEGRKILLTPAWPEGWNCRFKLHAPQRTVLEGEVAGGKLVGLTVTPQSRARDVEVHAGNKTNEEDAANDFLKNIWKDQSPQISRQGTNSPTRMPKVTPGKELEPNGNFASAGEITPALLKADPWVSPPRSLEEVQARVAELKTHYAPFLRSLPEKLELRGKRELPGPWRSHFEVTNSITGDRPDPPGWQAAGFDDAAWEPTTVPEWRWKGVKQPTIWGEQLRSANSILWYRTRFSAAPAPADRRVFLCFGGVAWEAEVWLNGEFLGRHKTYYEPFRFDVSKLLKSENTLAVRVISGATFGEPYAQWSLFPFVPTTPGENQVYVRDRNRSFPNYAFGTGNASGLGGGFGIHREVYLETTAPACVREVFARGNPATGQASVTVETDSATERKLDVEVQLLPENFEGKSYKTTRQAILPQGQGKLAFTVAMPEAKSWWPTEPNLYRCRVILRANGKPVDSRDVLFGVRSFGMVSKQNPYPGLRPGTFLLNSRPVYLRGTNLSGALNAFWYWNEPDNILKVLLMLKAGNFNAVRVNQHVDYPEVRELFDRLGIMSQQEQGAGFYQVTPKIAATLAETGTILARTCYNNPGVVLLSFCNENEIDGTEIVVNVAAVDPERIVMPCSGGHYTMKDRSHDDRIVSGAHDYACWYGSVHAMHIGVNGLWNQPYVEPPKLRLQDEYGAEALDGYETMRDHYPKHWGPVPGPDEDKLCGARQVGRGTSLSQQHGFRGKVPKTLAEYIEASQNYQADTLTETTRSFKVQRGSNSGYMQFHFFDGTPAQWPKSIVSHDFRPKKAYYDMAMINQPLVPLYHLVERGKALDLWVVNDLVVAFPGSTLKWQVRAGDRKIEGRFPAEVPAFNALKVGQVDLKSLPEELDVIELSLVLANARGKKLSEYHREIYRGHKVIDVAENNWNLGMLRRAMDGKTNVALNKPVMSADDKGTAANALDGNVGTAWQLPGGAVPQALNLDMGETTELCVAKVIWSGQIAGQILWESSNDQSQWKPVARETPRASETKENNQIQYFEFRVKARHVRATVTAPTEGEPVGLSELQLYKK